ncbi:hypothetical protein M728_004387 (plasmid) [Ensifer sp. WSM1721]
MNSATTTSSNEVTKAKSAPEATPGAISGSMTRKTASAICFAECLYLPALSHPAAQSHHFSNDHRAGARPTVQRDLYGSSCSYTAIHFAAAGDTFEIPACLSFPQAVRSD